MRVAPIQAPGLEGEESGYWGVAWVFQRSVLSPLRGQPLRL